MPQVTVFDMTGKSVGEMTLSDAIFGIEPNTSVMHAAVVRAHSPPSPVPRFPAAAANHGNRRALVVQDRALPELHSGHTAVSLWVLSQEITATSCQRK